MKDKNEYIKRVYRKSTNKKGYWFNPEHTLGGDFYPVSVLANFSSGGRFKVEYYDMFLRTLVTAWKDKHGNVIVRYMLLNKQTKIDF